MREAKLNKEKFILFNQFDQFQILTGDEGFENEEFISDLLKNIMEIAYERKLKVVPILPKIALFFRKNITYRDLLPPGIKI